MEEMKFYSEEEMLDKHVGKIGTPHVINLRMKSTHS